MKIPICVVLTCFWLAAAIACHGSVSDPQEISVKEIAKLGTTSDPAVRIMARHVLIPSTPDHEQIVRLDLFLDAGMTVDWTTLFVIDPSNDLIATTHLKATREKNELHYTISMKKRFLEKSTIHVDFKNGQTKRLLLGTIQLPTSGGAGTRQTATRSHTKPEAGDKPQPEAEGRRP